MKHYKDNKHIIISFKVIKMDKENNQINDLSERYIYHILNKIKNEIIYIWYSVDPIWYRYYSHRRKFWKEIYMVIKEKTENYRKREVEDIEKYEPKENIYKWWNWR